MDALQVRQLNRGQARLVYFKDHEADFPRDSPGEKVKRAMETVIAGILADAAKQLAGEVSRSVIRKNENMLKLKKLMRQINRGGQSLAEEFEGIEELFRLPYGEAEEIWLAKGRAFHTNSADFEAPLKDYVTNPDFRVELIGLVTAIEADSGSVDSAREQRGGATGSLEANFRELGRLGRKAHNIVMNKFEDDPEKLAAWLIASHLKAAPKQKEDEEPPPN